MTEKGNRRGQTGGGNGNHAGGDHSYAHCITSAGNTQGERNAPSGQSAPYVKDGMIYCEGRHLVSVRGGVLRRSFDATRELFRGGLFFRTDVLALAREAGCHTIIATDRATGQAYQVSMATFARRAQAYTDRRFGAQLGLALAAWQRVAQEGEPVQLGLFDKAAA